MTHREPCVCCGKDPIDADGGNLCRECFEHYPNPHPNPDIFDRK